MGNSNSGVRQRRTQSRASSVEELNRLLEQEEHVQRGQEKAETQQLNQYIQMAVRHLPLDNVLAELSEVQFRKFLLVCVLASFFRSATSSTKEIESLAMKILKELKSGDLKPVEVELVKSYVCRFLLGKYGFDVMDVLQPAIFSATKQLKRVYTTIWNKDTAFTCYFKVSWDFVKKMRGRLEEKLNSKLYPLFEDGKGSKSRYERALEKASTKLSSKYVASTELPADFRIDYEFGMLVCKILNVQNIMESWAAEYGENLPRKVIVAMPSILNSRAVHKQKKSISTVAGEMISLLKTNRRKSSEESAPPLFSQPSLFLSQIDVDESADPFNDSLEKETRKVVQLTLSDEEESSTDLFDDIDFSVPSQNSAKPTFSSVFPPPPSLPKKRKQANARKGNEKKQKTNILDGLPSLETF